MSIRSLFSKNNYDLNANSFNCETINNTRGQVITETNSIGQVLKIKNINPNEVEFQDESGGIPNTLGFPDGYVLKIIDNTTNEVNWEPDSIGGVVVPLVLTGDSPTAFQVRNTSLQPSLIIDTVNNAVQLTATDTRVEGADSVGKFGVYNNAESNVAEFGVDTVNHSVNIGGLGSLVPHNFNVVANNGNNVFNVNTAGSVVINDPIQDNIFSINPALGQTELSTSDGSTVKQIVANNTAGLNKIELVAKDDLTTELNATDVLNITAGAVNFTGIDAKNKFLFKNNAGDPVVTIDTTGGVGRLFVAGDNSQSKFQVSTANDNPFFSVDTVNKKTYISGLGFASTNYNEVEVATLDAPQLFNVAGNQINMSGFVKVDNKANLVGTIDYVGFIARNGGSSTYNIVNNVSAGLFFDTPNNAGIQTSALILDIAGTIPNSECQMNFDNNIKLSNTTNNTINVGLNNQITVNSTGNLDLVSTSGSMELTANTGVINANSLTNFKNAYPAVDIGVGLPTLDRQLTTKDYVDIKVGNLYTGISDTANVNSGSIVPPTGLGTLMVPANAFSAGDSFHLVMSGDCTFGGGDTITITLLANAVVIGTIVVDTEATATPPNPWELEGDFTIRSIGVSGSVAINFDFTYIGTNQNNFVGSRSVEVNTLNTTIVNMLGVNAVCSNGADSIRTRLMYLKKMF